MSKDTLWSGSNHTNAWSDYYAFDEKMTARHESFLNIMIILMLQPW